MTYFSYHNHTDYSNLRLIDSINTPETLLDRGHEIGLRGIAITDHETLSSFIRAEKYLASKRGVDKVWDNMKFVRGSEIYLTRDGLNKDSFQKGDRFYHFILLAKDIEGFRQLNELSSRAWGRGYRHFQMRVPTYYADLEEVVGQNSGHLIASTACLGGELPAKILEALEGKITKEEAVEWGKHWLERLSNIFGKENVLVELQPGVSEEQIFVNKFLYMLAKNEGYLPTITTDSHYLRKEDRDIHRAFLKTKQGDREVDAFYEAAYLMDTQDIHSRMDEYIGKEVVLECLENTLKVLDMVEEFSLQKALELPYLPQEKFDIPLVKTDDPEVKKVVSAIPFLTTYLDSDEVANKQFASRIIQFFLKESEEVGLKNYQVKKKTDYMNTELELIWDSGQKQGVHWSKYFLQSSDYATLWWQVSLLAPSRGSAGASYVCYALGITQIDPTREKAPLILQRFMNPDRASVLDIDLDVASNKRNECIRLMEETYGQDHVTRVATFKTETAKSAIQTAARAINMDIDEARYISSLIPAERGILRSLKEAYHGDEEKEMKPVSAFVAEMNKNPRLWQIAQKIEGLITGLGSHAGGVVVTEKPITYYCGVMKTSSGDMVTAYDLHELEDMSLIKIDLLATSGLQKIQTALELLIEYGHVERLGSLRETYESVLGVYNINRNDPKMWDMANKGQVIALFQFEKESGVEGMRLTKPRQVESLAALNSIIRLSAPAGKERPLDKFKRFSDDPEAWDREMDLYGLTEHQKAEMHKILDYSHGISAHQEDLYQLMIHPEVAGYSFGMADKLRKAVAKKNGKDFENFEKQFFKDVAERGSDPNLINYIWKELVMPQAGYSFNAAHTLGYSIVALQEMNLAYFYPTIYWNTANLIVDSDAEYEENIEDEEEDSVINEPQEVEIETFSANYGKIASAIGRIQDVGITVAPPNINESRLTYTPNEEKNTINYGLVGITKVGAGVVEDIINNRPFLSVEDFLDRVKVNKTQMVSLIKSGAFNDFGDKYKIMKEYIGSISGVKKKLNLQNANMLIQQGLIPDELAEPRGMFNYNKYLRKHKDKKTNMIVLDEVSRPVFEQRYNIDDLEYDTNGIARINADLWKSKYYDPQMNILRNYIKENHDRLLEQLNDKIMEESWDKYASGSLAKWSMDSVSFYQDEHELEGKTFNEWDISNFNDLPEEPEIASSFKTKRGHEVHLMKLTHIVGTVIDKQKDKSIVTLLTTDGVVKVKAYGVFVAYDKQVSRILPDGKKKVVEKSWFTRGNILIVRGFRRGGMFFAKHYPKEIGSHHFYKVTGFDENNNAIVQDERVQA